VLNVIIKPSLEDLTHSINFSIDKKPSLEDALQHYGIPGMKWGHRKNAGSFLGKTAKKFIKSVRDKWKENRKKKTEKAEKDETKIPSDRERINELLKKKQSDLSNKDLQDIMNRINLEKQVSQIKNPNKGKIKEFVKQQGKKILFSAGAAIISNATKQYLDRSRGIAPTKVSRSDFLEDVLQRANILKKKKKP
jgi:hypothetical protein